MFTFECPESHKHGETMNCYMRHGCRCSECVQAKHEYDRQRPILIGVCARCPQSYRVHSGKRWSEFCRDCRFYFRANPEEKKAWSA